MAGKTVSAHVDEGIARRIGGIAEVEGRSVSELAASALALYAVVPRGARDALRRIVAFGQQEDLMRVARRIERVLLDVQYEMAERGLVDSLDTDGLGSLDSEDDILEAATRLVRAGRHPADKDEKLPPSSRGVRSGL
ncbi:hypothetical protein BH20GEM2_BH20GEM2_09660 [soil metagenome]